VPIQLRCQCGQLFAVADRYAGTRLRCPKCNAANQIPLESAVLATVPMTASSSLGHKPAPGVAGPAVIPPPLPTRLPHQSPAAGVGANPVHFDTGRGSPPVGDGGSGSVTLAGSPFKPPRKVVGYRAERHRAGTVHWLAVGLGLLAVFQLIPALLQGSPAAAPTWAGLVWILVLAQVGYAVWMACLPDWTTTWTGMIVSAAIGGVYALALALVLVTPQSGVVWFDLDTIRRPATMWCGSVILLSSLLAYACGHVSYPWRKQFATR
jgi:hypothetical protein